MASYNTFFTQTPKQQGYQPRWYRVGGNKMNDLYDYLFHFNPYTGLWNAFKREDYRKYFNIKSLAERKALEKRMFKAKSIKHLVDAISNPSRIKKLTKIQKRLEYLREQINNENISYSEIAELQNLSKYIDKNDVQLLEWAGVPERRLK